jgi:hypothetical protein
MSTENVSSIGRGLYELAHINVIYQTIVNELNVYVYIYEIFWMQIGNQIQPVLIYV